MTNEELIRALKADLIRVDHRRRASQVMLNNLKKIRDIVNGREDWEALAYVAYDILDLADEAIKAAEPAEISLTESNVG